MIYNLALSLVPFVDTVAEAIGTDRKTALKFMVVCEAAELALIVGLVAGIARMF